MLPVIFGCESTQLSAEERNFFRLSQPVGLIVFARNIVDKQQLRSLVADFLSCLEHSYGFVMIDQEGGRVQRLKLPNWHQWPSAQTIGKLYETDPDKARELVTASTKTIGDTLIDVGITVNASPVLDLSVPNADSVIGDRAFSHDPQTVTDLGKIVIDSYLQSGILPITKHFPGHGRAQVDSHCVLPHVDTSLQQLRQQDFAPFASLYYAPATMIAHICYSCIDSQVLTFSKKAIDFLRQELNYQGLLISDCLHMHALTGDIEQRAQKAQNAGIDLLMDSHNDITGKNKVYQLLRPASAVTIERLARAWTMTADAHKTATQQDWNLIHCDTQMGKDPTERVTL